MMTKRKRNLIALQRPSLRLTVPLGGEEASLDQLSRIIGNFGFQQIVLPVVEEREVFLRDPLLKQHFGSRLWGLMSSSSFPGAEALSLCPTYFLSVCKRYLQNFRSRGAHVAKWFYLSPVIDLKEGQLLKSHELGIFILGEDSALANAQLINVVTQLFNELGIGDFLAEVNSLGCATCQKDYLSTLREYLRKTSFELCTDCLTNLETVPMTVWSCEKNSCQTLLATAPQIVDFLDESCRTTLVSVLETIDELGIPYTLNPVLNSNFLQEKVLFRLSLPERSEVLGYGGSYTSWVKYLGEEAPLIGFLVSLEKLWSAVSPAKKGLGPQVEVFIISLGQVASRRTLGLYRELQRAGILTAEAMLGNSGIKNQLAKAQDCHAAITLIIGQKEAIEETVILRDMRSGMQEVFRNDRLIEEVKKRLGK